MTTRRITVSSLARVEGEGALDLVIENGTVAEARLSIYEPPRFFEAFLRGREPNEAVDITARICGICPVAYQLSAIAAVEDLAGARVPQPIADLRRLFLCGEWISSHTLHVLMLHAPDFLGYDDALKMAETHREEVENGLALKKAGNRILSLLGGREIHPVNARVGGFYRVPTRAELAALVPEIEEARERARHLLAWVAGFSFPESRLAIPFLASAPTGGYPMLEQALATDAGSRFPAGAFEDRVRESHMPHSTALYAALDGGLYLTGPLARFAVGAEALPEPVRDAAAGAGLEAPCRNSFCSILVRAVEVLYSCEEALRLIAAYEPPENAAIEVPIRPGTGYGCVEAPRGVLYQRYTVGEDGLLADVRIVPPTAQNQAAIEADLRAVAADNLDLDESALQWRCEQTIRNYDPCISCAAHFLTLRVDRR